MSKSVKICPQCGSTDIGIPPAGMDLRLTFPDFCRKCQNKGMFPIIDEDGVKEFQKSLK